MNKELHIMTMRCKTAESAVNWIRHQLNRLTAEEIDEQTFINIVEGTIKIYDEDTAYHMERGENIDRYI